ncbi:MAG: hypothetical protein MZV70_22460 [Desulfobacterales bacterium]|nr:hypothetical protein [Desulfobacterales bacterium]
MIRIWKQREGSWSRRRPPDPEPGWTRGGLPGKTYPSLRAPTEYSRSISRTSWTRTSSPASRRRTSTPC